MSTTTITRGDLVLVRSTRGSGIVMITHVMSKLFVGCLIHTWPEMATDADVVFPPGSVMPYPVVVQFDLYGTFYRTQAVRVLGRIDLTGCGLSHDPYETARLVAAHTNRWRGLPVWRNSPRWHFKVEQLQEDLQPLVRPFWSRFKW